MLYKIQIARRMIIIDTLIEQAMVSTMACFSSKKQVA